MECGFPQTQMTLEPTTKLIREGRHVAEVPVTLIVRDHEWYPCLSADDVRKLEAVRDALRRGDLKAATELARVYELTPIVVE